MKKLKKLVSLLLVVVLCVTMTSSAFAANVCSLVKGNSCKTVKFYVETDNSTSGKLTFTQSKGKISYTNDACGTSTANMYGAYAISVQYKNSSGKMCYQFYTWEYNKSFTLKLSQKNTMYLIQVAPYPVSIVGDRLRSTNMEVKLRTWIQNLGNKGKSTDFDYAWSTNATWTVSGSKITWCYQK
ncbi:MAG: hypothetical protein LUH56_00085 [Oscillospiraceae bacterium]|nr:hypothetical protein [Oscillospiraceae bacterium]